MKKILTLIAIAGLAVSGFSQGFIFQSTKAQGVYFSPTTGGYALGNNTITVGFMWAAASTVSAIGAGSPTNSSSTFQNAWSTILTDPNFHFATNGSSLVSVAVNNSGIAQAGFNYNAGAAFVPLGTTPGSVYSVFAVAWSSLYADPLTAAANNSFVGWSSVVQYTSSPNSSTAPPTFAAAGMPAFGVVSVAAVPEPSTLVLAGLGGLSLLAFRRKK